MNAHRLGQDQGDERCFEMMTISIRRIRYGEQSQPKQP